MAETPKERIGRITRTEARNAPLCGDLTWLLRVCEAAIEAREQLGAKPSLKKLVAAIEGRDA